MYVGWRRVVIAQLVKASDNCYSKRTLNGSNLRCAYFFFSIKFIKDLKKQVKKFIANMILENTTYILVIYLGEQASFKRLLDLVPMLVWSSERITPLR